MSSEDERLKKAGCFEIWPRPITDKDLEDGLSKWKADVEKVDKHNELVRKSGRESTK